MKALTLIAITIAALTALPAAAETTMTRKRNPLFRV